MRHLIRIVAVGTALSLAGNSATLANSYFEGKSVSMLVGFAAGGGIDTVARMFARHFARHIEGNPQLVIQNMPGAAGMIAMNQLANASPKDGTVLAYDTWAPLNQVIGSKALKFDYSEMTIVGALQSGTYVMFARKDVVPGGLKRPADIVNAKDLVYAGQQPTLVLDIHGRVALNLLKLEYKYISGYKGAPDIRTALERGEANITTHGLQGYRVGVEPRYIKEGLFVPLWYFQRRNAQGEWLPDETITTMPSLLETYREIHGEMPAGVEWDALKLLTDLYGPNFLWAPPGTDTDALEPLRKAFYAAASDPAFLAEQDKILGFRYRPIPFDEAQGIVGKLTTVAPELRSYFKNLMQ